MDKKMSQLKQNITLHREGDQGSEKNLNETNFDEDSGLGVSGYSYDYPLDKDSVKLKIPTETPKQKELEQEPDYLDSGFESGIQSGPIDQKEMNEKFSAPLLKGIEQLHLTDSKQQYQKNPKPTPEIVQEIFSQDEDGDTQLHIAISTGSPALIKKMIDCAPYPYLLDIENDYGQSPIHVAVLMGESLIVRHLLICGAKATVRDYEGNTPLHLACKSNDVHSVEALLNPISSAELKQYGFSNQLNQLQKFQRIQIDLEQKNYFGENCIHIAVINKNFTILKQLLIAGANINAKEGHAGHTALHIAVENQDEEMVKFLLKNGTGKLNVETLSYGQITAYQLASEYQSVKIMKYLEEFGCEKLLYPESEYDSTDDSDMDSDD